MKSKSVRHVMALAAASLVSGLCLPTPSRAVYIDPGDDLYNDAFVGDGSQFFNVPTEFEGVPLNTFDFGSPIGPQNVGNTDTIIQRLGNGPWNLPLNDGPIQLDALQLKSVAPAPGTDEYWYLNLDSSNPSTGTMTINANGTFSSTLNVYFDVWTGAIGNGTPVTGEVTLNASGNWSHNAPPANPLIIPGVNYLLNGVDTSADFWPVGPVIYSDSSGDQLTLEPTPAPEPSTLALLGIAAVSLLAIGSWRQRAKA
jgi:hypothetical protein